MMSRFARVAALLALVAALCCRTHATAAVTPALANLDSARMFDPASESLLGELFAPKNLSPISVALFHTPAAVTIAIADPVPAAAAAGSSSIVAVNLHPYAPPSRLPSQPLLLPPVVRAAPIQRARLAEPHLAAIPASPAVRFGSYTPYVPASQTLSEDVNVPVRIGGVHFSGVVSGIESQSTQPDAVRAMQICGTTDEASACPYLHDTNTQSLAAGTNFDVRAGNTQVNFQFSGSVGSVTNRDSAMYQYSPLDPDLQFDAPRAGAPDDGSLLYYPGLTEVVRHGIDARVAVPLTPAVTLGLQYDTSHYQGNYGALLAPGLDARKDTYLGNVTYQLPNSSSLLTLSARQYHYQDSFAPNFNLTQTRADLNFTVKF